MKRIVARCAWCDQEAGIRVNYQDGERVSHGICQAHMQAAIQQAKDLELPEPGLRNKLETASQ